MLWFKPYMGPRWSDFTSIYFQLGVLHQPTCHFFTQPWWSDLKGGEKFSNRAVVAKRGPHPRTGPRPKQFGRITHNLQSIKRPWISRGPVQPKFLGDFYTHHGYFNGSIYYLGPRSSKFGSFNVWQYFSGPHCERLIKHFPKGDSGAVARPYPWKYAISLPQKGSESSSTHFEAESNLMQMDGNFNCLGL